MTNRPAFVEHPDQYATSANLAARQRIYQFSASAQTWHGWVFDHFHLPTGATVLELGCGNGELWRQNLDRIPVAWDITLSDRSAGMLGDARYALGAGADRFHLAQLDAQNIPFPDACCDAVIANHMLYHVPDRPRAYGEIRRVLKPAGMLFAATNGQRQVREIMQLVDARIQPALRRERKRFTLEGGQAELEQFFAHLELHRLRGELRIPDATFVIDYIRSLGIDPPLQSSDLDQIRDIVQQQIATNGVFRVTTETGLFIARLT